MKKNEEKSLKTAEKCVLTSFGMCGAPESWSKYTSISDEKLFFGAGQKFIWS